MPELHDGIRKYETGHVNDPKRSPEENGLAKLKIQDALQLREAKAPEAPKNESALDFKNRMLKDLEETIFTYVKSTEVYDDKFFESFTNVCAQVVKEKYWSKRNLAERTLREYRNSKTIDPKVGLMIDNVLEKLRVGAVENEDVEQLAA